MAHVGSLFRVAVLSLAAVLPWAAAAAAAGPAAGSDPGETARQALETAGVNGGLVVHLGCGDGRLTTALGAAALWRGQALPTTWREWWVILVMAGALVLREVRASGVALLPVDSVATPAC